MAIITGLQNKATPQRDRLITVAVDFDGVLHKRPSTERGGEDITGQPIPGAMNFIRHLVTAAHVVIFSARFDAMIEAQARTQANMIHWFRRHLNEDSNACIARGKNPYDVEEVLSKLKYTATKPKHARVFLDDRAVQFNGTFPSIPELLRFKTWNE